MKKAVCFFALGSLLAITSCNSSTDTNNTKAVEAKEDQAKEAAGKMKETAADHDTTAVQVDN